MLKDVIINIVLDKAFDWSLDKMKEKFSHKQWQSSNKNYQTMMYQAVINAISRITYNLYRDNPEIIYEAAELLIKKWLKKECLCIDTVSNCLTFLGIYSEENCEELISLIVAEIVTNEELKSYFALDITSCTLNQIKSVDKIVGRLDKKVDDLIEESKQIKVMNAEKKFENVYDQPIFKNNKKHKYIEKWNSRLFLHQNENDIDLRLSNTFIWPNYFNKIYAGTKDVQMLKVEDDLENKMISFLNNAKGVMFILGQPGTGKTSIVAWIANRYSESMDLIVLRFCDWEEAVFNNKSFLDIILQTLDCRKKDLEDKILILDGFDELKYRGDRERLIKVFLMQMREVNIKIIITSRPNYINLLRSEPHINLVSFDINQICKFYKIIRNKRISSKINLKNLNIDLEVLGIPVILYMTISTGISFDRNYNKYEIYEKIFSIDGGIFDRFSTTYLDGYEKEYHLLAYIKEKFCFILQDLAFQMFDQRVEKVSHVTYLKLVEQYVEIDSNVINDFPIKNLYEGNNAIEFVHKSIYEYFAAEYLYKKIKEASTNDNWCEVAKTLGYLFKNGSFADDREILAFLSYRIMEDNSLLYKRALFLRAFEEMILKGCLFYTEKYWETAFNKEIQIFCNILFFLRIWKEKITILLDLHIEKYIWASIGIMKDNLDLSSIVTRQRILEHIDLSHISLKESEMFSMNLEEANLTGADLTGIHLEESNLRGANLTGACLREAELLNVDLSEANLTGADLTGADLTGTDLTGAYLLRADFVKANLNQVILKKVRLEETKFDITNIKLIADELYGQLSQVIICDMRSSKTGRLLSYDEYIVSENDV